MYASCVGWTGLVSFFLLLCCFRTKSIGDETYTDWIPFPRYSFSSLLCACKFWKMQKRKTKFKGRNRKLNVGGGAAPAMGEVNHVINEFIPIRSQRKVLVTQATIVKEVAVSQVYCIQSDESKEKMSHTHAQYSLRHQYRNCAVSFSLLFPFLSTQRHSVTVCVYSLSWFNNSTQRC